MIFKDKNFVTFWVGSFVSGLGDAMFLLALSWMVIRAAGSAATLGLLMAAMSVPQILLSLMGGVLIDRLDPKRFMMVSDAVRLAAMLFLVVVSFHGMPPVWSLFLVAVIFGMMDAGFWPAAAKFEQDLVAPDQYVQSNGSLMVASQTTQIAGPALAGVLAATGHFDVIIALNAATYGVSLACLTVVTTAHTTDAPAPADTASVLGDMTEGIRYVLRTPLLVVTSLAAFVVNACLAAVMVAIPLLAHQLHGRAQGFGWMTAALGVGGALGAVVFAVIRLRRPTPPDDTCRHRTGRGAVPPTRSGTAHGPCDPRLGVGRPRRGGRQYPGPEREPTDHSGPRVWAGHQRDDCPDVRIRAARQGRLRVDHRPNRRVAGPVVGRCTRNCDFNRGILCPGRASLLGG